jgi:hypothetical protein
MGYEQFGVNQLTNRAAGAATDFGVRLFKKGLDKLKHRKHEDDDKSDNLGDVRNQSFGKPSEANLAKAKRTQEEICRATEQQVKSGFNQIDELLHGKQLPLRELTTPELFDVIGDRQSANETKYAARLLFNWCADNGHESVKEEDLAAVTKYALRLRPLSEQQ